MKMCTSNKQQNRPRVNSASRIIQGIKITVEIKKYINISLNNLNFKLTFPV